MTQAIVLPLLAFGVLAAVAAAASMGHGRLVAGGVAALVLIGVIILSGREFARSHTGESLLYPIPALILDVNYTASLATHLIRNAPTRTASGAFPVAAPAADAPVRRRGLSRVRSPLTFVLALQTVLALTMVWSNTAFGDEALYLWEGHLEWGHWLHGTPLPVFHDSGAPQIYPVIGAVADKIGGIAGARLLSMVFMLVATALLYAIGKRLFGTVAAFSGVALWVVSEPVLRLTFATYDPVACLLTIASVYLAMRSAYGSHRGALTLASGLSLALASVTAESFAIMIPAVVVVSFFMWQSTAGIRGAAWCAASQAAISIGVTAVLLTELHLWQDAIGSTVTRSRSSETLTQGITGVLRSAWSWDGLILGCAIAAAVIAFHEGRGLLVSSLALCIVLVPVYQTYLGTSYSMDKHISAGSGLAALAVGYGVSKLRPTVQVNRAAGVAAIAAILAVPAVTGIWYARSTFSEWPNLTRLLAVSRQFNPHIPVLVSSSASGFTIDTDVFNYYLPRNNWAGTTSFSKIAAGRYGGIISSMPGSLSAQSGNRLIRAIDNSHRYVIADVIPYVSTDSADPRGIFVVWRLEAAN
jgi:hypothetical protein